MNCQDWEDQIALYVAGDGEAAEVERHIAECAGCTAFSNELKESLELLRAAHREELAPAHYTAVRTRVMAQLVQRRTQWWRRGWLYGLAVAAAAALVLMLLPRPHEAGSPVRMTQAVVKPPVVERPVDQPGLEASSSLRSRLGRAVARRKVQAHHDAETILVKLETDNPDVVIYWIAEKKGD